MDNARASLLRFGAALGGLLLALEGGARIAGPRLHAGTNRGLAKLALLERQGPIDLVFAGSSRTQDGVSPRLLAIEVAGQGGPVLRAFNLAFTSSTLATLEAEAKLLAGRPGLRLVVLELSAPQIADGRVSWVEKNEELSDGSLEGRLGQGVRAHVTLVRERAVLIPENLARFFALLAPAGRLDGSEVHVAEQLAAAAGIWRPDDTVSDGWEPPLLLAGEPLLPGAALEQTGQRLLALARVLRGSGVQVAFAVPPLSPEARAYEHDAEAKDPFQALARSLAREVPVFDGTKLVSRDRGQFHDTTHLNTAGRAGWSRGLGRALGRAGLLAGVAVKKGPG